MDDAEASASRLIEALRRRAADRKRCVDVSYQEVPVMYGPATSAQLGDAERVLGFALPPLLRRLYLDVANGGFGPEFGMLGTAGGACDDLGATLENVYVQLCEVAHWPVRLVPIAYLGCDMAAPAYACVDCSADDGPVVRYDLVCHPPEPRGLEFRPLAPSLSAWLDGWLAGRDSLVPDE